MPIILHSGRKTRFIFSNTRLVVGVAICGNALILLGVMLFSGRKRSNLPEQRQAARAFSLDPLTQPVPQRPI